MIRVLSLLQHNRISRGTKVVERFPKIVICCVRLITVRKAVFNMSEKKYESGFAIYAEIEKLL